MLYRLEIVIRGPANEPLPPNENKKRTMHYHKRSDSDNRWKRMVQAQILVNKSGRPKEPLKKAIVTVIRYTTKRRRCDGDAIPSACKPVIDGLVEAGILVDDNWDVIGMPIYDQKDVGPGEERLKIIVEEIE